MSMPLHPETGNITSNFDLPDEIGGRSYAVEISGDQSGQTVDIFRDYYQDRGGTRGNRGIKTRAGRG